MWFLYRLDEQNQSTGEKILARPGREYTIGRKGTLIIFNDKSVSRSHAKIIIGEQDSRDAFNKHFSPEVRLTDQNSKYGTFLNTIQVETESVLVNRDVIKFGSLNSAIRLVWEPVLICVPSMSNSDKTAIAKLACQSGIGLTKEWDESCTHLYMKNIEIKAKLFLCLTSAKRVISIQWLEALSDQNDTTFAWPDESNYLPHIPSNINNIMKEDFEPKPERATLFSNLEFRIFDRDQFDRYTPIIKSAGGSSKLCSLQVLYTVNELCEIGRIIVIPPERHQEKFDEIIGKLAKKHKRAIKGNEISDAIVACSRSKYCNPAIPEEGQSHNTLEDSVVRNYDDDDGKEEEDIVIMSDPLSNIPSQTMKTSHAVMESPSIGDFFDGLLGEPDTVPDSSSIPQVFPVTSSHGSELNDGKFTEPAVSSHQQHSNNGYDGSSDSESAVPGREPVANKQTAVKNTTIRTRSRRQLPGQLCQQSTAPERDRDDEVVRSEPSPISSRARRQLPKQITYDDVPGLTAEGSELPTRPRKSPRQLPEQLQIPGIDNNDVALETTQLISPISARPRRQLPGIGNASREPESPPATSAGIRRTITQRETVDQQQNGSIGKGSSSVITEPTSRHRQRTASTTTRSQTQNTGTRRRTNNNDEFPGLPDIEQDYNRELPLVSGKKYTAVLSARIICSTPSNDIRSRAQEDEGSDRVNFKRFKKVHRSTPYNPIDFIPATLTQVDRRRLCDNYYGDEEDELEDSVGPYQNPSVPVEGFGDIEIKVVRTTASRRSIRR